MANRPSTPLPTSKNTNLIAFRFPTFLLPSFAFFGFQSQPVPPKPSSPSSSPSSPLTSASCPSSAIPGTTAILACLRCQSHLTFTHAIISKAFTARHGRAYLISTLPPTTFNLSKPVTRQLATGTHTVADISCAMCLSPLGWKYIAASDPTQQYKIGKFILETERIVRITRWDRAGEELDVAARERREADERGDVNSEDDEELEDMFTGEWTPELAQKRRSEWTKRSRSAARHLH